VLPAALIVHVAHPDQRPDQVFGAHIAADLAGGHRTAKKRACRLGQAVEARMMGAFAAGRIINPKLVRSQLLGGMIWGVSFALHEKALVDRRSGRVMNADLAEYHVPVNADVPSMDVLTVEEHDPHVNALGIKGVGEIGITGSAGAVANAVWHATGIRVRRFPIRIENLVLAV